MKKLKLPIPLEKREDLTAEQITKFCQRTLDEIKKRPRKFNEYELNSAISIQYAFDWTENDGNSAQSD